jgi:ribosomal protein S18
MTDAARAWPRDTPSTARNIPFPTAFCAEKIDYINYKDVRLLMPFLPERGKIQSRRISGTCALHQRKLQTALKRAPAARR